MRMRQAALVSSLLSLAALVWQPGPSSTERPPRPLRALPGPMDIVYWSGVDTNFRYGPLGAELNGLMSHVTAPATATFVVTYDANFPPNSPQRTAFQAAVDIWSNVVTSSVPIRVNAQFTALGTNVLGSAGPTAICAVGAANQFYAAALADKIAGMQGCSALLNRVHEIDASFSSSFANWDFGTTGVGVAGKVNFMTVVLHELGHGLGFYGSFRASSGTGCANPNPTATFLGCSRFSQPDVFDLFAVTGAGTSLRSLPNASTTLAAQLVSNDVFFNGTNARANNLNQNAKLESHNFNTFFGISQADNGFLQGSSFSHVDDVLYTGTQNGLMTWALGNNEVFTDPGPIVRGIFTDEGWTIAGSSCTFGINPTSNTVAAAATNGSVAVTTTAACAWTAVSNASFITVTLGAAGTGNGTVGYSVAANTGANQRVGTITIAGQTFTVTQSGTAPVVSLDRTALQFAATNTGSSFAQQTLAQTVRLAQSGSGTVTWTATPSQPWITVSPTSGSGPATLTIGVQFAAGVPATGSTAGTVAIALTGAGNSVGPISVGLTTIANGAGAPATGVFETPTDGATGLTGSFAVTGWAIDDIEVRTVRVMRDPVAPEPAGALIFIGNAVLVDGARPDIAALNPTAPRNTRAGWGYLLLSNFLPNLGTGTYRLYAFADDADGHTTLLGSKTISCANSTATKPFGAIDTPGQGDVVSGASFANFGWVLARGNVGAAPPDGGTVQVVVDGVFGATPTGWVSRSDLTALFPAATFPNVSRALGVSTLNTTTLANGVHTIAWVVSATNGQADGIGSRFFTVANGSSLTFGVDSQPARLARRSLTLEAPPLMTAVGGGTEMTPASLGGAVNAAQLDRTVLRARRGFARSTALRVIAPDAAGRTTLYGEELDRFEVRLSDAMGGSAEAVALRDDVARRLQPSEEITGYMRVGQTLGPLPIGSHLDRATGTFTWQPGPGFLHAYDLVFVRWNGGRAVSRQEVRIVINAKGTNRVGPQVVIDTPAPNSALEQPFVVAGWAIDPDASFDTGVDTLHVWAYPTCDGQRATCNGNPLFLGATAYGGSRPDVAAIFGERFRRSGYGLTVQSLPAGTYDLAVFAWSTATNGFVPAKVVRITVR